MMIVLWKTARMVEIVAVQPLLLRRAVLSLLVATLVVEY
jgi:hypothetical protein